MRTSLSPRELAEYVTRLLASYLPDGSSPGSPMQPLVDRALERVEHSFSKIRRKYYEEDGTAVFDHLNGDHVATFLYMLANSAWSEKGDTELATRLFYMNKVMHGLDLFYSVAMPEVFMLVHPVGTVLGKAVYGDYFVAYQNCTVGADGDSYPTFGEGVIMYSRSAVVGSCSVGSNVVFGANAMIVNTDVPDDSVVVGQYPAHRILPATRSVRDFFAGGAP